MHHIGIDISKTKLDCCWLSNPENNKIKTKVFKNTHAGHDELAQWLKHQTKADTSSIQIVMESTGIYHEPLAYSLHKLGFKVCVLNPARSKDFANSLGNTHKTDLKDSFMLALFSHRMMPKAWQPESPEVRELKALLARFEALETDLQRELNRLEKARFSCSSDRIIESITHMVTYLTAEKKQLEQSIDEHIDRHPQLKKDRDLMTSIPGVGQVVSRVMLSVLHGHQFTRAGQVAAFIGLIPRIQESGQWKGRSRLSKQGSSKVRAKLYMAAVTSVSCNPDLRAQYQRLLSKGKSKMQAIVAAMRKLVQICFGVVKNQSEYRPQCLT